MKDNEMFNQMADYYDRFRPGYPTEIIRQIVEKAALTADSRVLEIGAGSGKATAQFAEYGFDMLCIEPGKDLADKGRERFKGKNVTYAVSRFEDYPLPEHAFDAVISAQAFHWVEKPLGYELCACCLKDGGWLMPFWNIEIIRDTPLDRELFGIIERYDAYTAVMKAEAYTPRVARITAEIADSGFFRTPEVIQVEWERTFTAEEYFGYAMTGNVFIRNPEEKKRACYEELLVLAEKHGGIRRRFVSELYAAQKNQGA